MTSIIKNEHEELKRCEGFYEELKEIISTNYGFGDYSGIIAAIEDEEMEIEKPIYHLPTMNVDKKRCLTHERLFEISKMIWGDLEQNLLDEIGIASQYGVNLLSKIEAQNTLSQIYALEDLCRALAEDYVHAFGFMSIIETVEDILDEHAALVSQSNGNMTDFTKVLSYDVIDIHRLYCQSGKTFEIDRLSGSEEEMITLFTQRYFSKKFL